MRYEHDRLALHIYGGRAVWHSPERLRLRRPPPASLGDVGRSTNPSATFARLELVRVYKGLVATVIPASWCRSAPSGVGGRQRQRMRSCRLRLRERCASGASAPILRRRQAHRYRPRRL